MLILLSVALYVGCFMISSLYRRKCDDNVGYHIGKKHMREDWGIEENRFYRE